MCIINIGFEEKDIFVVIFGIIILTCIFMSFRKLHRLQKMQKKLAFPQYSAEYPVRYSLNPIKEVKGGKITDVISTDGIRDILNKYSSVKKVGYYNYTFDKERDNVMELTQSVVS